MKIWQVILATLIIFGTGVVTGGLLVDYSNRGQRHWMRPAKVESARPPVVGNQSPEKNLPPFLFPTRGMSTNFIERLDRELKLSDEQRDRIRDIMAQSQQRTKELWKQIEQPIGKEIHETKKRIRAELNPSQKEKFEKLMERPRKPEEPSEQDRRSREQREQRRQESK